jgi:mannitol/fructose-specific phosphotransferase system IIA component
MDILSVDRIQLKATAVDKMDAIRQAGELLVQSGCVTPAYVDGMLAREQSMSTYLDNGVAIPHGQYENKDEVINAGISVVQIPAGVVWEIDEDDEDDVEKAYLVVGIAASSDEHVDVLTALAEIVEDEQLIEQLHHTSDVQFVLDILSKPPAIDE